MTTSKGMTNLWASYYGMPLICENEILQNLQGFQSPHQPSPTILHVVTYRSIKIPHYPRSVLLLPFFQWVTNKLNYIEGTNQWTCLKAYGITFFLADTFQIETHWKMGVGYSGVWLVMLVSFRVVWYFCAVVYH